MKMLNWILDVSKLHLKGKPYRYFVIELADIYFPKTTRRYYNVKPKIYVTEQGLQFETYLNIYSISNDEVYLDKIKALSEKPQLTRELCSDSKMWVEKKYNWSIDSQTLIDVYNNLLNG